jgi:L-glyceraldehyde 3-phosphate reductase
VCEANRFMKLVIHQPNYSMLNRWIENDLLPVTSRFGIGTIAFSPLAQGLLTNKYLKTVPDDSRAKTGGFLKEDRITPALQTKLNALNDIAQARGQSLAQMTLAWTLRPQGGTSITTALIGASRPSQIVENVKYREKPDFSDEELKKIETILAS